MALVFVFCLVCIVNVVSAINACMYQNTADGSRCGICVESCPSGYAPFACYNTNQANEVISFQNETACNAYVTVATNFTSHQFLSKQDGFPVIAGTLVKILFSKQKNSKASHALKSSDNLSSNPLEDFPPGLFCIGSDWYRNGTLSGQDFQDCANQVILEKGEEWLEAKFCDYASGGVLLAFCESKWASWGFEAVNNVINSVIEKPIVTVMDTIEDAAASAIDVIGDILCFFC